MKTKEVRIEKLTADPRNARKHSERNLAAIRTSLESFGQQKPIVVSPDGVVVAGNGTLAAAVELGWETVAVVESGLDGLDAKAYALADNRTAELAEWDSAELSRQFAELAEGEDLLDVVGFDEEERGRLSGMSELKVDDLIGAFSNEVIANSESEGVVGKRSLTLVLSDGDFDDVRKAQQILGKAIFSDRVGDFARKVIETDEKESE